MLKLDLPKETVEISEYNKNSEFKIISWYTAQTFLYGLINNTIRKGDLV